MTDSNRQCLLRGNLVYGTQSVGTLTIKGDQNTFGLPNKIMGVVMQKRGQPGLKYLEYHEFPEGGDGASEERQMFLNECEAWWRSRRRVVTQTLNVRARTYKPLIRATMNTSTESFRRAAAMVTKHLCFLQNQVCKDRIEGGRKGIFFKDLAPLYNIKQAELDNKLAECIEEMGGNDLEDKDPLAIDEVEAGTLIDEGQPSRLTNHSIDATTGQPKVRLVLRSQPSSQPVRMEEGRSRTGSAPESLPFVLLGQPSTSQAGIQLIKSKQNFITGSDYLEPPSSEHLPQLVLIKPQNPHSSLVVSPGEPDPLLDISKFEPPYRQGKHLKFVHKRDAFGKPTGTRLEYERTVLRQANGTELWYLRYPHWDLSQKIPVRQITHEVLEITPINGSSTKISQFLDTGSVGPSTDSDQCTLKFREVLKSRCKANLLGKTPAHLTEDFLSKTQKLKRKKWLTETRWHNNIQEGTILEEDLMEIPCKVSPIYSPNYFK